MRTHIQPGERRRDHVGDEAVPERRRDNRVAFDPAKKEFKIIHPCSGTGDSFKYLGPIIDTKISMHDDIQRIVKKCRSKNRAIIKARGVYSAADLIHQFKTHVWCLLEGSVGAIFHAYNSDLHKLNHLQNSSARELIDYDSRECVHRI